MRSLSDYEGEGGKWLTNGWHDVTVKEVREFDYNSGNHGVEFLVEANGAQQKVSFCLVDTILWRLVDFCKACGLTTAEIKGYDVDSLHSHRYLVGRVVAVEVTPDPKNAKYGEIDNWQSADAPRAALARAVDKFVEPQPPTGDEIPF